MGLALTPNRSRREPTCPSEKQCDDKKFAGLSSGQENCFSCWRGWLKSLNSQHVQSLLRCTSLYVACSLTFAQTCFVLCSLKFFHFFFFRFLGLGGRPLCCQQSCSYSVVCFPINQYCLMLSRPVDSTHFRGATHDIMTNAKKNQRADIKFCVLSGFSREETVRHIRRVHARNSLSVWSIRQWFAAFQNGWNQVEDLPHPGQPLRRTAAKIQTIQTVVQQD